ncbi:non-ribosomal peptide synthetase [Streptomyces tsukubensis]|uniref:Non-ribosomal peptide synthetase n=1 Tax=Streptomyces tsukubensis TaxID=83656 RepID=A0A1V4A214_9ACTN|nr:non-ribosomal peptide synthetase [Streptomyces tsukubensis]OON73437.1 non-ribosomal peptide synthetase [Streptomyces tsukubensis]QFR96770.1 amino acid adenylation domain-containing protein [Streptomyces tsukubensis]
MSASWQPIIRTGGTTAPLSAGQRSLWFLDRRAPGTATYNLPWVQRLRGRLDPALVERALRGVVERHEVLRTVFSPALGEPRQVVRPEADVPFTVRDLTDEPDPETRSAQLLHEVVRRPFDLEKGPLLRGCLLRTGQDQWALAVVFHHIVWDELSTSVFERELVELYDAAEHGRPPGLAPLPVHFADYARWQRGRMTGSAYERELNYWDKRLGDAPKSSVLPADRRRPAAQTFRGATATVPLSEGLLDRTRDLAQQEGVTGFMVLLAAFATLMHRHSGQADLVVGTPVAGRDRLELEGLLGYFVNMLALRIDLGAEPTFRQLLDRVRDTVLEDFDHQDVPFEAVVDRVTTDRSAGHSPLVQVVFGYHTSRGADRLRIGDAVGSPLPTDTGTAKFDLIWSVCDEDAGASIEVEYNTDLFDEATVVRMAGRYVRLMEAVTADPETGVGVVDLLTDEDRVVVEPVAAPRTPVGARLHETFERVAAEHPGRTAVSQDGQHLTYAELNSRANRLARYLQSRGVKRGDRVGLSLERGPAQVEAVLAVLKAGAAYVPVNPADPVGRRETVLGDAEVLLVLGDEDVAAAGASEAWPEGNLPVAGSAEDSAYVIFTSGSTGRPKGVEVAHRNVAALFEAVADRFAFGPHDVWTAFHSYAFDFSVWEMWGALLYGGRLVVVPLATARAPGHFAELLVREEVTILSQTPSALAQLTAALAELPAPAEKLRWVVLGGEALQPHHVAHWFERAKAPGARLCNMYGITETTVHVTAHEIDSPRAFDHSVIGRPLPHLSVAVLDPHGAPVPIGVVGEMVIGGSGVAKGYVGNPELTARRFTPGPVLHDDSPWYRSGDLARWREDGTLEYRGRGDDQVKIRGFRVEPGEIRHALLAHPRVEDCAVVAHHERDTPPYLVAYVVGLAGSAEVRAFLGSRLAAHLMPSIIMSLDALPLTSNGKVDLRALPDPRAEREAEHTAPGTEAERLVAEAWQEVLGLEDVGREDNFFSLGGDSIRSVQVAGMLREHGYELDLEAFFTTPVLAELAPRLRRADAITDTGGPVPFALVPAADRDYLPAGLDDAYPMTSMQLAMVYHMEADPGRRPYQNVNSYRMSGAFDERAFAAALTEVTHRHPVLRTGFDVVSFSRPMQLVHRDTPVPLVVEDLRALGESAQLARVEERALQEWAVPFDLATAPLLRVLVQRLAEDVYQLTLVEHHAILDGWSFTSLFTELLERHAALRDDPTSPPAPAPTSLFRDYVALEAAAQESAASREFWERRMSGVRPTRLGTAPRRAEGRGADTGVLECLLPATLAAHVPVFAAANGVGAKSVALSAHIAAVSRLAGAHEVVTGLTVNGRLEDGAGTEARGVFLNTVPLRVPLEGETWTSLVREVHRQESEIVPHRRTPYGEIARHLADPTLDCSFTFNRFHALGRLSSTHTRIVDQRLGVEPTVRREPNHFALNVAFVQDPTSDRSLLIVDSADSSVTDRQIEGYVADFFTAIQRMAEVPDSLVTAWRGGEEHR